jgi:ABC-type multidrug transport system fused ATPase/permease subunit
MEDRAIRTEPSSRPEKLNIVGLVRPYWKGLVLAFIGVLGESMSDVLEPWPVKVVIDNVLHSKMPSGWLGRFVSGVFGADKIAILNFAVAAVAGIAVLGAISSYTEKYLTTSVSQWVTHDLRRSLYNHIQRLSLIEHEKNTNRRPYQPCNQRHRYRSGLHKFRAIWHRGESVDADRNDRGDVLH